MASRSYRIFQVDAFTTERFRGNPAGVVPDADGLSESEMQAIARELNNPETAFVLTDPDNTSDVWVRFFTPTVEVPLCGHATVASHYVRARELSLGSTTVRQRTGVGVLPVDIIEEDSDFRIEMTQAAPEFLEPLAAEQVQMLCQALGINPQLLDPRYLVQPVSTGHPKLIIALRTRDQLNALEPDMAQLSSLSKKIGCNGYMVFAFAEQGEPVFTHARMFAPAIGIPEDPVTGMANGPLGAYLVQHGLIDHDGNSVSFTSQQGEAMGRCGHALVTVDIESDNPTKVRVSGRAVVVFESRIEL